MWGEGVGCGGRVEAHSRPLLHAYKAKGGTPAEKEERRVGLQGSTERYLS
jgi:hypothetical protein